MYCSWLGQKVFSGVFSLLMKTVDEPEELGACFYILAFFSFLLIIVFFPFSLLWSIKVFNTHTHTQCAHLILSNYVMLLLHGKHAIETQCSVWRTFTLIETFSCVSHSQLLAENQYSIFLLAYVCTQLHMQTLFVPEVVTY